MKVTLPAAFKATPYGELKEAAVPTPSVAPMVAPSDWGAKPAMVVTAPETTLTKRTTLLPASA